MVEESAGVPRRHLIGRRQLRVQGAPRQIVHKVKVSEAQELRLSLLAAARNVSVSRLLVESALSGGADNARTRAELAGELFAISRLLGKLGVNINQIARATNATGEWQPDTAAAIEALGRVCVRLHEVLTDADVAP